MPYKIILKRLWYKSDFGSIKINDARKTLNWFFRMGKENWNAIFQEMKCLGYIKYLGPKYGIRIVPQLKDLV